jgi:hypothetical protein
VLLYKSIKENGGSNKGKQEIKINCFGICSSVNKPRSGRGRIESTDCAGHNVSHYDKPDSKTDKNLNRDYTRRFKGLILFAGDTSTSKNLILFIFGERINFLEYLFLIKLEGNYLTLLQK